VVAGARPYHSRAKAHPLSTTARAAPRKCR